VCYTVSHLCWLLSAYWYSLRPKINAILGPVTENNARCEMTKIPFILYEKDLAFDFFGTLDLSYMWEASRFSCLLWLISPKLHSLWDKFWIL
jgi:hypothetical protein